MSLICYYWFRSDARWFFVRLFVCCCFWLGGVGCGGGGGGGGGDMDLLPCVCVNHEYSQGLPSSGTTYMFYAQVYV